MKSMFKKIRNWIMMGKFISIFIVAYKCDDKFDTFVIECESWAEAYTKAHNMCSKMSCNCRIVNMVEY